MDVEKPRAWIADLCWVDGAFRENVAITTEGGIIRGVGALPRGVKATRLAGRALLPGFVNAHSHAFQRLLRGRVQTVPQATPDADFWSWRTLMYEAADRLDPDAVRAVSAFCYLEMLRAGITSVAEFHYLHHNPGGAPYADPTELSRQVAAAAGDAGIRLRLLPVGYQRSGPGRPPEPLQRRFCHAAVDDFLALVDDAGARLTTDGPVPLVSVGVALHSVRAVPAYWLREVAAYARGKGLPLHVHVAEQPAEIATCLDEHGLKPVNLLEREGVLGPRTTLVHAIHLEEAEMRAIGGSGAVVCACPTTERDLGDGIVPAKKLGEHRVVIALGSDSHAEIDLFSEMRALEGHERLQRLRRCVLQGPVRGEVRTVAPRLLAAATTGGAASLGLDVGVLEVGAAADFITVDLDDVAMVGASGAEGLEDHVVFSGRPAAVRDVVVGGRMVVEGGRHPAEGALREGFRAALRGIWG